MTEEQAAEALGDVWVHISRIAKLRGEIPVSKLDRCWHCIAGKWELWVNGTDKALPPKPDMEPIPRFEAYVEFNGWAAGMFNPHGGSIAYGEAANVCTLRDALAEVQV